MCLYNTKQETKFMLNIKLINRLICLEQVVDAMFKDDAPEIAEALKLCINVIFGDMYQIIPMQLSNNISQIKRWKIRYLIYLKPKSQQTTSSKFKTCTTN